MICKSSSIAVAAVLFNVLAASAAPIFSVNELVPRSYGIDQEVSERSFNDREFDDEPFIRESSLHDANPHLGHATEARNKSHERELDHELMTRDPLLIGLALHVAEYGAEKYLEHEHHHKGRELDDELFAREPRGHGGGGHGKTEHALNMAAKGTEIAAEILLRDLEPSDQSREFDDELFAREPENQPPSRPVSSHAARELDEWDLD